MDFDFLSRLDGFLHGVCLEFEDDGNRVRPK